MNTSDSIKNVSAALVKAQGELNAVNKDGTNPHFKSKYATLQNIVESTRETLRKHGLAVVQTFNETDGTYISLTTTLLHESGEYISGTITMRPTKSDPQSMGGCATYARRYSYAIIGLVTDEDDDGNMASQPSGDRASQGKPDASEKEWLNITERDGTLNRKGIMIVDRILEDPEGTWHQLKSHYRINKQTVDALTEAVKARYETSNTGD